METTKKRYKYEFYNNSKDILTIDLHNGYTIIAIKGFYQKGYKYNVTLFLKENTIDDWKLIEKAEHLEFNAVEPTKINSVILKTVSTMENEGFFDYYIDRYEYEAKCTSRGNDLYESEKLSEVQHNV